MKSIIAGIPFSFKEHLGGGTTPVNDAPLFLRATVNSLLGVADEICIFYRYDEDLALATSRGAFPDHVRFVHLERELTSHNITCMTSQQLRDIAIEKGYKYVYYTNADQILHARNIDYLLSLLDEHISIHPQRLEQIPSYGDEREICINRRINRFGTPSDCVIEFSDSVFKVRDNPYAFANVLISNERVQYLDWEKFYLCCNIDEAYAGAYLCTIEKMKKADFNETQTKPMEAGDGTVMHNPPDMIVLKTVDKLEFFVEHLSVYRWNIEQLGYPVNQVMFLLDEWN